MSFTYISTNRKPITRREFLRASGAAAGAAALACAGAGCSAQPAPAQEAAPVDTPTYYFGKDALMNKRILVAYATRTGSTVGVASAIGETLGERGFSADVKPLKENPSIDGYDAVIIGSAVNGASWLPEAVEFVKNNQAALNQLPVALFCVHAMNLGDDEGSKKNRYGYLKNIRALVKAQEEVWFAGQGADPQKESRFVIWMMRKVFHGGVGDCRDWDKIRGWAQELKV